MLANKNSIALLLVAFAATAPFVRGSGEQLQCGEPKGPPYDHGDIQDVPKDAKFGSPEGDHNDDWSVGEARSAAEEEIGNTHDPFTCSTCSGSGCSKDVLVNSDDAAWEYEFIWCFGAEHDCNEAHFYYTRATLTEGGYYLRRCTECE